MGFAHLLPTLSEEDAATDDAAERDDGEAEEAGEGEGDGNTPHCGPLPVGQLTLETAHPSLLEEGLGIVVAVEGSDFSFPHYLLF